MGSWLLLLPNIMATLFESSMIEIEIKSEQEVLLEIFNSI